MNCVVGDLAVIVSAKFDYDVPHIGKIVRCIQTVQGREGSTLWETQPPHFRPNGQEILWADFRLRPIRDQPGQDEVLRLVGLPNQPEKVHLLIDPP